MDSPEVAKVARNFAALARIRGPDPKSVKMRRHAFHLHQSGTTTLSASAVLLPAVSLPEPRPLALEHVRRMHGYDGDLALTMASLVEPFLVAKQRNNPSQELSPALIPDAQIDLLVEGKESKSDEEVSRGFQWLPARLLALVDVPASSRTVASLLAADSSLTQPLAWEVGWSLANTHETQVGEDAGPPFDSYKNEVVSPFVLATAATRIAVLAIPASKTQALHISVRKQQQRGDPLLVVGSPFGALSPLHFLNSISVGTVANSWPSESSGSSLLMADIHCLPGMEGAPVFDKHAHLLGMLLKPLRQKDNNAEIQLLMTWDAIATSWEKPRQEEQVTADGNRCVYLGKDLSLPHLFSKALSSVILIVVGNGSWASGVLLNPQGLVLTNAHLLEPWRFGRTSLCVMNQEDVGRVDNDRIRPLLSNLGKHYGKISARVDDGERQVWCNATVVYISSGPLDVALLQLENAPKQLSAIDLDFRCPSVGRTVHVIGHGLLAPRSGCRSSVSSGVLSKVVDIPRSLYFDGCNAAVTTTKSMPVMLQTTASVHPGASGGAVVNSEGQLIGLVTSNARHNGGRSIPNMNFSIPCESLSPILKFAEEGDVAVLQALDRPNETLSSIWSLAPTGSILDKKDGEKRGTRFSKFLAEWSEEMTAHHEPGKLGGGSFKSKL